MSVWVGWVASQSARGCPNTICSKLSSLITSMPNMIICILLSDSVFSLQFIRVPQLLFGCRCSLALSNTIRLRVDLAYVHVERIEDIPCRV